MHWCKELIEFATFALIEKAIKNVPYLYFRVNIWGFHSLEQIYLECHQLVL